MYNPDVCCREFLLYARVLRPWAALVGLLFAGLSAGVTPGQELDWATQAGGTESDHGSRIAVDKAGNSYVTGFFGGAATFGLGEPNQTTLTSGGKDVFVAKYGATGALVWARRAGGTDHAESTAIAVDAAGNSYVTGFFTSTITFASGEANQTLLTGIGDVFLAKYDSAGALSWAKSAGGTAEDSGNGIAVDGAGNSYVTGLFGYSDYGGSAAIFGSGEAGQTILQDGGIFLAKYDRAGALVWARRASTSFTTPGAIVLDGAGNSYMTGNFQGMTTFGPGQASQTTLSSEDNVVFVTKHDSAGALVWVRQAGTYALGSGIAVDEAGNSYVTGGFGGPGFFGGSAPFGAGETNQTILASAGNGDAFVAKYNTAGALQWAKRAGGTEADSGSSIAVDGAGNSYVTGVFHGSATFGPGEARQTILTNAGDAGVFVARYDSAGALVWAKQAGTNAHGIGIAVDGTGNGYITGFFGGTATFGPGEANQTILASAGDADVFVARYGAGDQAGPITSNVVAEPNPGRASQIVQLSAHIDDSPTGGSNIVSASFEIRDGDGKVLHGGAADNSACPFPEHLCPQDEFGNPEASPPFDAVVENVRVLIPASTLTAGDYNACMQGKDALGNVGEFQCSSFILLSAQPPPRSRVRH